MENSNKKYSSKDEEVDKFISEVNKKSYIVYTIIMTIFSFINMMIYYFLNGLDGLVDYNHYYMQSYWFLDFLLAKFLIEIINYY